jgi:hypothetical protein
VGDSNGRLLPANTTEDGFAKTLVEVAADSEQRRDMKMAARRTARKFSVKHCAERVLSVYEELSRQSAHSTVADPDPWDRLLGRLEIEWNLLVEKTAALAAMARETDATKAKLL